MLAVEKLQEGGGRGKRTPLAREIRYPPLWLSRLCMEAT